MKKAFFTIILMTISVCIFGQKPCSIDLDTAKMNAVLLEFIRALTQTKITELARFSDVPNFIKEELNCLGNFKIAERGDINYQSDCLRYPSAPYRKVEFVGISDAFLMMSYRLGGLVEQPHILIVQFKDKKVTAIWSGQGFGTTKEKILNQLKKNAFAALNWI